MEVKTAPRGMLATSSSSPTDESRLDGNALAKWEKQKKAWAKMQEHLSSVRDGNRANSPGRPAEDFPHKQHQHQQQQPLSSHATYPGVRNCDGTLKVNSLPGTVTRQNDSSALLTAAFAASDGGHKLPEVDYRYNYSKQFTSPRPLLFSSSSAAKPLAASLPPSNNAYDPADCLKDIEWISSLRVPSPAAAATYSGKESFQQVRYAPVGNGYPYKIFSQKLVRPKPGNGKMGTYADGNSLHRYSSYLYQQEQQQQASTKENQRELRDSRNREYDTLRSDLYDSKTNGSTDDGMVLTPAEAGTAVLPADAQESDSALSPSLGPALRLKGSEVTVVTRPGASKYVEVVMSNVGSTAIFYTLAPRDRRVVAKTVLRVEKPGSEVVAGVHPANPSSVGSGSHEDPLTVETLRSFRDSVAKESARKFNTTDAVLSRPSVSDYFLLSSKRDGSILPGETKVFSFCIRSPISGTFVQEYDLLTVPSLSAGKCSEAANDVDVSEWTHNNNNNKKSGAADEHLGSTTSGSVKGSVVSGDESSAIPVIIRAHIIREVDNGESLAPAIDHLITRNAERDTIRTDLRRILQPGIAFDAAEMTSKINAVADAKAAREAATKRRVALEERHWHEHNNNLYYKHCYLGEDLVQLIFAQLKRIESVESNGGAGAVGNAVNPTISTTAAPASGKNVRNGGSASVSSSAPPARGRGAAAEGKVDKKRETAARLSPRGGKGGRASDQYSPEASSQSLEEGANGDDELSLGDKAVLLVAKSIAGESGVRALLQIPYNRFVFEKLASLHENLRETIQMLGDGNEKEARNTTSSNEASEGNTLARQCVHRKWNGSIQALMEDISDLRPAPLRNKLVHALHVLLRAASVSREPEESLSVLVERAAGHLALGRTVDEMTHAADAILQNEAERHASATISTLSPPGSAIPFPSSVMKSLAGVAVALQGMAPSSQEAAFAQRQAGELHNSPSDESTPDCVREQRHQELMVLTRNALLQGVSTLCDLVDGSRDAVHVACDVPLLSLAQSRRVGHEYATIQRATPLGVDTTTEIAVPPPPATQGTRPSRKR